MLGTVVSSCNSGFLDSSADNVDVSGVGGSVAEDKSVIVVSCCCEDKEPNSWSICEDTLSSDKDNGLMFGNFKNPNTSNILGHSSISLIVCKSARLLIIVIYLEINFIELTKIEKV